MHGLMAGLQACSTPADLHIRFQVEAALIPARNPLLIPALIPAQNYSYAVGTVT